MKNIDLEALSAATESLKKHGPAPALAVVLGSGLGAFAEQLNNPTRISYVDIPRAPSTHVQGHAGVLVLGEIAGLRVAVLSGRVHAYEGHGWERATFLVRALARWGSKSFLLTNAAGGVNESFQPGDLMLLKDHLNLTGGSPLLGENDDSVGPRFLDLTEAYDRKYQDVIRAAAKESNVPLREGVYAGLLGPSYETPAEIRMLRTLGADAVGMSTVAETIALRHLGVRVAAISCITNAGAGISGVALSHAEVKEVADKSAGRFIALLTASLKGIASA